MKKKIKNTNLNYSWGSSLQLLEKYHTITERSPENETWRSVIKLLTFHNVWIALVKWWFRSSGHKISWTLTFRFSMRYVSKSWTMLSDWHCSLENSPNDPGSDLTQREFTVEAKLTRELENLKGLKSISIDFK